jgi:hypothetical protein
MMKLTSLRTAAVVAVILTACSRPAEPASASTSAASTTPAAVSRSLPPADVSEPGAASAASILPADLQAAADNFEMCEHWAGEEPYDDDRRRQIEDGVDDSCGPLKAALPALDAKYGADEKYQAMLAAWHETVDSYTAKDT